MEQADEVGEGRKEASELDSGKQEEEETDASEFGSTCSSTQSVVRSCEPACGERIAAGEWRLAEGGRGDWALG